MSRYCRSPGAVNADYQSQAAGGERGGNRERGAAAAATATDQEAGGSFRLLSQHQGEITEKGVDALRQYQALDSWHRDGAACFADSKPEW